MNGREFIEGVKRKLADEVVGKVTDRRMAEHLGITVQALNNWRGRGAITVRQMTGVLFRTRRKAVQRAEQRAIRPIVEFFKLDPVELRDGARIEIFGVRENNATEHPYLRGLHDELDAYHGIYIFHDSRGCALYVGKTRQQSLWREINNAYNRDRSVQKIRRVDHPERRQEFRTSDEKRRQIRLRTVPLHDLAAYLSAYHVAEGLMAELELLLIRGFANDLLNVRMENFGWEDDKFKHKRKRRKRRINR